MQLSKIRIKNYRLLIDAELEVDPKTTLIVGRNNTAKTSCFSCIGNVLEGNSISFNDYPLLRREDFYTKIALFMEKKLSYEDLCSQIEVTSIDFLVDYSLEDPDDNLGALSPFIIDVDVDTTTALIRAEYRLKTDEKTLWSLLESSYYKDGTFSSNEEAHNIIADNFGKLFGLTVYAINPNNLEDKQVKSPKELHDLFPFYFIPAERVLGEDDTHNSSLGSLISSFFDMSEADLDPDVAEEIKRLRTLVEKANKDGIQYLYHDDVLKLFCLFLDNAKFRRVFADKYPLILIDEYQDSYKPIIDRFIEFFISKGVGPQFGFFGDAWQTIYQSNKACGEIKHDKIEVIKKGSNFRSAPRIVQLLNDIRPELPQKSAIDGFDGEVLVITCDDYSGARRTERNFKNELPADELRVRLNNIREKIEQTTPADEELKVLMITHKVLASQQGYEQLLDILDDGLRNKEDPFLIFFADTIEPIYYALNTSNIQLLFDTLGIKRYPITKKSEKTKWKSLCNQLTEVRAQKAIDVLEAIIHSKLVPLPPKVDRWYRLYKDAPETMYASEATIQQFLQLDYAQFIAVRDFLYPDAQFSTEHGVKGEEYDNVVFVISKGWNQYQFETYAPMITGHATIPKGKEGSYERNRNLFYVCCSRPKKRLFFFVTVPIETAFRAFLVTLVGEENILTYEQFMKMVH